MTTPARCVLRAAICEAGAQQTGRRPSAGQSFGLLQPEELGPRSVQRDVGPIRLPGLSGKNSDVEPSFNRNISAWNSCTAVLLSGSVRPLGRRKHLDSSLMLTVLLVC